MYPELFRIGDFPIMSFGLMMFLSFVGGAWILGKQLERYGLSKELAWDMLAWLAVGGIIGAKIYYLALNPEGLRANFLGSLFSRAGLVWYGGLIGGIIAYYLQIRRRKLPMATMFDAAAPALPLAIGLGRIGCFLVGDDYGVYTDGPFGVEFPANAVLPSTAGYLRSLGDTGVPPEIPDNVIVPVHPTQLYEVGIAAVMFIILWRLGARRTLRTGQLFALFLGMYGIERFFIEMLRIKDDRFVFGLSTAQLLSIGLVVLAVVLWQRRSSAPLAPLSGDSAAEPATVR